MFDLTATCVLARYPAALRGSLVFLGNHGGFSGARLWRVDADGASYCLKAWPADGRGRDDFEWIHRMMARGTSLPWLPRLMSTAAGSTVVSEQGRQWELSTWMPGSADFSLAPTPARLTSVCEALARLHEVWAPNDCMQQVCPAVLRRWDSLRRWRELVQSGWRPAFAATDPLATVAEPLWRHVQTAVTAVPALLTPWSERLVTTQPCVCDLWHDHVLFTRATVTGIVDFGSVKVDHVAVDLARLLGSLVEDNVARWSEGFAAYARIRPLSAQDRELARILDRTGTVLAATHWLRWLYHEKRAYPQADAVLRRLTTLHRRVANLRA